MRRMLVSAVLVFGLAAPGCQGRIGRDPSAAGREHPGQDAPAAGGSAGTTGGAGGSSAAGTAGAASPAGNAGAAAGSGEEPDRAVDPIDAKQPFACGPGNDVPGPRRLWRLFPSQYRTAIYAAWVGRGVLGTWNNAPPQRLDLNVPFDGVNANDRFPNFSRAFNMSDDELWLSVQAAEDFGRQFVEAGPGSACVGKGNDALAACVRNLVADRGAILFSRPVPTDEQDRFAKIAADAVTTIGEKEAAVLAFQAMFSSPELLFRREGIAGAAGADGVVALTPFELAGALSYSLTDGPPDPALWDAAASGKLSTPAQITDQVARLVFSYRTRDVLHPVVRFFREYLHYGDAVTVAKEPKLYPFHNPGYLVADMDAWLVELAARTKSSGFIQALLTSATGRVRGAYTGTNFDLTGLAKTEQSTWTDLDPTKRAGFLTQPAWLTAFSLMADTNPVKRGKFVRESLLCDVVPALPLDQVPPLPDLGANATMRDRLAMHAQGSCVACHKLMDPLGLAFETHDDVGRFRSDDHGRPPDGKGALTGAGAADGPVSGAVDLAHKLATSPTVAQCITRHVFEFFLGRTAELTDSCTLMRMAAAAQKDGGDLTGMLSALFTSNTFLTRSTN